MQKIYILLAVITLSLSINAQMKTRNLQVVNEEPAADPASLETKKESANSPSYVDLNNSGVKKALAEGDYKQAITLFLRAVELKPDCFTCRLNLGRSFLKLEKYDDAVGIFNQLTKIAPDNANAQASLGEALNAKGFYKESLPFFARL